MLVPSAYWRRTAVVSLAAALLAGCTPREAAPPLVQLVETRPVEAALGDAAIPAALDVWLDLIHGARHSLALEGFYLSTWPGEPLEDVLDALGQAAERGVQVRLILDARMYATYPQPADSLDALANVEVRQVDFGRIAGGVQHAKFFLVDQAIVCLGSQNFDWRALKHIHELGVVIRDEHVAGTFQRVFEMDWAAAGAGAADGELDGVALRAAGYEALAALEPSAVEWPARLELAAHGPALVWPSISPRVFLPDSNLWDRDAIVRLLDGAQAEVVVQLLSYALESYGLRDTTLDAALRRAAGRGVSVRLLFSDWQADRDERVQALQALAAVPGIEAKLSHVPEWSGGYIPFARVDHCKFLVVDEMSTWIGTSNWGPGYFATSRNIAVTIRNRGIAGQVRGIFEVDWNDANTIPVTPGSAHERRIHGDEPPPGSVYYGG